MAGLTTGPNIPSGTAASTDLPLNKLPSSYGQFKMIAWLRWRIFINTLRGRSALGEVFIKFLSYPILGLMIFGPAVGAAYFSYYLVSRGMDVYLAIVFWVILLLWQFIGISTSTTGPSFDLSTLIRFPIRYRDYLLMRLSFGLMDPPTLAGIACLLASSLGIAVADPSLFPWALLVLLSYALCNIFFSRMIYSWMERWLAKRRTRELLTGAILFCSLGFQFAAQFVERLGHRGHHAAANPLMLKTANILVAVNWWLPPGLTASSIRHMHQGVPLLAAGALAGLLVYTFAFLRILHIRLYAEYRGESLSEAPAARVAKARTVRKNPSAAAPIHSAPNAGLLSFLSATVAACFMKEVRYLLRSGPKLYVLVMPIFMVFVISMKNSGLNYAGLQRGGVGGMLFTYGCAYTQLVFVGLLYNSLGGDGAGIQFYFMAPLRIRDVMLAKNLLTGAIFAVETLLIYIVAALVAPRGPIDLAVATVAWCVFALFINMSVGNIRSINSPKRIDTGKVRSQNVSGMSGFIAVAISLAAMSIGALTIFLCGLFNVSYWIAAAVFVVLAAITFAIYLAVLRNVDTIAREHVEDLTLELCKR
jgi:ABC-2 type transport system permease protein